jgi:YHS domain-containing protein
MTPHPVRPARVVSAITFVAAALHLALLQAPASCDEPASVLWRDDYGSALEEAGAANRLLWIQFTGPWCPNCTRMERDSFPDPAIVEHSHSSFLPLKLRSDVNEQLVAAFNLTAIPATIVVAPNRDVIGLHQGYMGPLELDAFLRDCLAQHPLPAPRQAKYQGGAPEASEPRTADDQPHPELVLSGYCAVSLIEDRKLAKGMTEHAIVHEGRTYLFASLAAAERFRQEPTRYRPWSNGNCPVAQFEDGRSKPGEPRWGVLYAGRLFVCASESNRRRFVENPDRFATAEALDPPASRLTRTPPAEEAK